MRIARPPAALTPLRRIRARYDVGSVVDQPGEWLIHAELLIPAVAPGTNHLTLLCCTPGGGCTGDYFDLGEPDAGYSFARYAGAAGFACALIDNLGTGQSSAGDNLFLSPQTIACAGVEAFRLAADDLRALLPAITVTTVAVGHSMGAMLALIGEAIKPLHTAIACLGFTTAGLPSALTKEERRIAAAGPVSLDALKTMARQRLSGQPAADAPAPEPFPFNLPGDDPVGLAALRAAMTNLVPLPSMLSIMPGNVTEYIRQIKVPVFLGGGDHEPWHTPAQLVPAFANSTDVTFYTLADSAHNHNIAGTRRLLWRRLLGWAAVASSVDLWPTGS